MKKINELFTIIKGSGEYFENYSLGNVPLVSSTSLNNGVMGFVKTKPKFIAPLITVERITGKAFVQLFDFVTVPDDLFVLIPKNKIVLKDLFSVAAAISKQSWRFSYSRKLTPVRLGKIEIISFEDIKDRTGLFEQIPIPKKSRNIQQKPKFKEFSLGDLSESIEVGKFHVRTKLKEGKVPFISCKTGDNGIAGHYVVKDKDTWEDAITIASDASPLTTYYHPYKFTAQDNVIVCKLKNFDIEVKYFIALQLNLLKWKFSYGRKCYYEKTKQQKISLPIKSDQKLDTDFMKSIINNSYGWEYLKHNFLN